MIRVTRWSRVLVLTAVPLATGCLDSIVREIDSTNDPKVTNTATEFRYRAEDLRNVNDRLTFVWTNSDPKAKFHHDSFIHHGYGIVMINDANGVMVDSTLLELNLEAETKAGTPGDWTITLTLAGARGRVDFKLTPEP
jgi:hypothetical protein